MHVSRKGEIHDSNEALIDFDRLSEIAELLASCFACAASTHAEQRSCIFCNPSMGLAVIDLLQLCQGVTAAAVCGHQSLHCLKLEALGGGENSPPHHEQHALQSLSHAVAAAWS